MIIIQIFTVPPMQGIACIAGHVTQHIKTTFNIVYIHTSQKVFPSSVLSTLNTEARLGLVLVSGPDYFFPVSTKHVVWE